MIVDKEKPLDYEPVLFQITPVAGAALPRAAGEQFIDEWLTKRQLNPVCELKCRRTHLDVSESNEGELDVAIEWLCPQCMDVLFAALDARFGNIERIHVGSPLRPATEVRRAPPMVTFGGRTVMFEDGRAEDVGHFTIVNADVTVGEMEHFCEATGYLTSAERRGTAAGTFRDNSFLDVQEPSDRKFCRADYLSYEDAAAYCAWAGYRLPTEGEFFVAALMDDQEHKAYPGGKVVRELESKGEIMAVVGPVITDSRSGDLVVVRSGPVVVKRPSWKTDSDNRRLVAEDEPAGTIMRVRP